MLKISMPGVVTCILLFIIAVTSIELFNIPSLLGHILMFIIGILSGWAYVHIGYKVTEK